MDPASLLFTQKRLLQKNIWQSFFGGAKAEARKSSAKQTLSHV